MEIRVIQIPLDVNQSAIPFAAELKMIVDYWKDKINQGFKNIENCIICKRDDDKFWAKKVKFIQIVTLGKEIKQKNDCVTLTY